MQDQIINLQKFVANNYDLEKLEAQLNEFNPLKVLKVDQYEIRHSNILAWLLTPNENHKLGYAFLKKILAEIIVNNENIDTSLSVFDIEKLFYTDFEIRREWKKIDILIISNENKICVLIENKVHSGHSKSQLQKYLDIVEKEYTNYRIIPILLTIDGEEASHEKYGVLSHHQILTTLKFVVSLQKENISDKVYDFIYYYLKTLELLTMENLEVKNLCKQIYKDHKEALDLIYEYKEDTEFEDSAREFIQSIDVEEIFINGKSAWFIPKKLNDSLGKTLKGAGEEKWCNNLPFAFWFPAQKDKIGIIIEVRPFDLPSLRTAFLKHLRNHGFDKKIDGFNEISDRSLRPEARYTRIFSKYSKFEEWDNKESIIQKMDNLYQSKVVCQAAENILEACKTFNWSPEPYEG
ncbi:MULTISPECIES: PD-(D/E)XK nuclease family protein [Cyanophyceae]|uniref:PDDEXK-like family protein n=1 Tax=Cyanophyceae TaxID=3028117 RepID=UPI00016DC86C|nr:MULTISPECIES: PD-(D/E)XK nuclease family protein [Cyanophyceae]ACA98248.1 conserved hypothetical protein [Picosynechococcus sp. PCC 7002]SMH44968.1 PD-(D/E)XK nuclease superfamily protein [Picosynechococcus sp. OG1]SMQ79821.1 PD-(D/E)XK nuclease superfamily protein [Synechococcus sp. 7002]